MLLPKEDREERAIRRFLEYYNRVNGTSYDINRCKWLDRSPRSGQELQGPIPDCLCVDVVSGTEMVIECTMLIGEQDLQLSQGAEKFLADVRTQLSCKLPGVFLLYDWGVNAISFKAGRKKKVNQLCRAILTVAPRLADGEEVFLSEPFPVKLRKEEPSKVKTNCDLVWVPPVMGRCPDKNRVDQQLRQVLNEANSKFGNYSGKETVLLVNVWETMLDYKDFDDVLGEVDMNEYPNIRHIYLSEGSSDPLIHHLWSRRKA